MLGVAGEYILKNKTPLHGTQQNTAEYAIAQSDLYMERFTNKIVTE